MKFFCRSGTGCFAAMCVFLTLAFAAVFPAIAPAASKAELSAKEILDKVDDLYRGDSARGRMTMTVVTKHWTRSLTVEFWAEGKDKSLYRILQPKKEQNTATLRVGNDIWNYLPKVNRVIKLPSSMMSASWMGSHFTNDDLVKESRFTDDYTFEKSFEGKRDGGDVVEITCHPKEDAPVVWGKVVVEIGTEHYLPHWLKYYDEDGKLARTMSFSKTKQMGGRLIPTEVTLIPESDPGEKTVVTYEEVEFDVPLDKQIFSLRNLER